MLGRRMLGATSPLFAGLIAATAQAPPGFVWELERCSGVDANEIASAFSAMDYGEAARRLVTAINACAETPRTKPIRAFCAFARERAKLLGSRWHQLQKRPQAAAADWLTALLSWEDLIFGPSQREIEETFFVLLDNDEQLEEVIGALFPAEAELAWGSEVDPALARDGFYAALFKSSSEHLLQVQRWGTKSHLKITVSTRDLGPIAGTGMQALQAQAQIDMYVGGIERPVAGGAAYVTVGHPEPTTGFIAATQHLGKVIPFTLMEMLLRRRYLPDRAMGIRALPPAPSGLSGFDPPPPMSAPPPPTPAVPGRTREIRENLVAVLDLRPLNRLSPDLAVIATAVTLNAAGALEGVEALGTSDMEAILAIERRRDLLGCDDVTCYADIGGSLGAAWVLHGTMGGLGREVILTLTLINTRTVTAERETRTIVEASLLRPTVEAAVLALLRRSLRVGR